MAAAAYFEVTVYFRAADFEDSLIELKAILIEALLNLMMCVTYFVDIKVTAFPPALLIVAALHYPFAVLPF